ncbi:hypothetical protein Tco_1333427 [Tanacetum coccineum]
MVDSWKAMDLSRFVVKDDMIDYVLHKYGSNRQVHDTIANDILDNLLKREWEKQKRVKYDKRKVTQMKIQDLIEKRIEKDGHHLNKLLGMLIYSNSDESSDHNPFQVTSDESSDDTLKSSFEDL